MMRMKVGAALAAVCLLSVVEMGCKKKAGPVDRTQVGGAQIQLPAVAADSMVGAAAALAARTLGSWPLSSCGEQPGLKPVLLISVEDELVNGIDGRGELALEGPGSKKLSVTMAPDPAKHSLIPLVIDVSADKTSATAALGGHGGCPAQNMTVLRNGNKWQAAWETTMVTKPPATWDCITDADCEDGFFCDLVWKEWDVTRDAWVGSLGTCLPGKHCDSDSDCPAAHRCFDEGTVISALDGTKQEGACVAQ